MSAAPFPLSDRSSQANLFERHRTRALLARLWRGNSSGTSHQRDGSHDQELVRLHTLMRLALAAASLVTALSDLIDGADLVTPTHVFLVAYCAQSLALYALANGALQRQWPFLWSGWLDLAWLSALIAISGGRNSVVFFACLLGIAMVALRSGAGTAWRVTIVLSLVFGGVGYLTSPASTALSRSSWNVVSLLAMGGLMTSWCDVQRSLIQQLSLLRDVVAFANPRFGVDRTIANVLERLRIFFSADSCIALTNTGRNSFIVRRSPSSAGADNSDFNEVPAAAIAPLLALGETASLDVRLTEQGARFVQLTGDWETPDVERLVKAGELLEARSFVTVPWVQRGSGDARLFVAFKRARKPDGSALEFLAQVVTRITPMLESVRLVDRLASDAADTERRRIALDLHDGVVQPYIGIRMALAGMREKLRHQQDVAADVERLDDMMHLEIQELRQYLSGLKGGVSPRSVLVDAVRQFANRFCEVTGISIRLDIDDKLQVNDRLSAEAFQLVVEGLSNVRRHSDSTEAAVSLRTSRDHLHIQIRNAGTEPTSFSPKSMTERVATLGGQLRVFSRADGGAVVSIEIPL